MKDGHCEWSSATRKPPTMLVLFEILFFSLESNPGPRSHTANWGTPAVTTRPSRSPMTTSVYRALPPLSSDKVMASIWRFFHCLWQRSLRPLFHQVLAPFLCSNNVAVSLNLPRWWGSGPNSKHWFTTSFLQPLRYLVTP